MLGGPLDVALISLPPVASRPLSVRETLDFQVEAVLRVHRDVASPTLSGFRGRDVPAILRANALASGTDDEILRAGLTLDQVRFVVAREHEFRDWPEVIAHGAAEVDRRFEAAVDAIVEGNVGELRALCAEAPALSSARSAFGHHATLLHYVAANGVEPARQWSPPNAPAIARTLLGAGADPNARSDSYGGRCTTPLELLVSSSHPAEAGVQADLVEVMCQGGANPNGPDDDGGPLWTAITFGYTRSVERLVQSGARVDNLVFAAVLGDLDLVRTFFGTDGQRLRAGAPSGERVGRLGPMLNGRHTIEYALIYAAGHGRRQVVEFLLSKHPDLSVTEPVHGGTALGWARHPHALSGRPHGSPDIAELLRSARA
jgi:hypothetical protein